VDARAKSELAGDRAKVAQGSHEKGSSDEDKYANGESRLQIFQRPLFMSIFSCC
jgi:hypothetical protein